MSKLESVFRYIAFQMRRSLQGSEDLVHNVYESLIFWPLDYLFQPKLTFDRAEEEGFYIVSKYTSNDKKSLLLRMKTIRF